VVFITKPTFLPRTPSPCCPSGAFELHQNIHIALLSLFYANVRANYARPLDRASALEDMFLFSATSRAELAYANGVRLWPTMVAIDIATS
jgi:hypothetical protein